MATENAESVVQSIMEQILFVACVRINFTMDTITKKQVWDELPVELQNNFNDREQLIHALDLLHRAPEIHPETTSYRNKATKISLNIAGRTRKSSGRNGRTCSESIHTATSSQTGHYKNLAQTIALRGSTSTTSMLGLEAECR